MFADGVIRVRLNWHRLREPEVTVCQSFSRSCEVLGDLHTVWYVDADGRAAEWNDKHARPVRVREATDVPWHDRRARRLAELEAGFRRENSPVQLLLPTYAVGSEHRLIIDGNHRAVAAYRAGIPVSVKLIELHGPADPEILPDLRHYSDL